MKKFYIIGRTSEVTGLCALMTSITNHCLYAQSKGYIPIVDLKHYKNQYFKDGRTFKDNTWEYFFEQPMGYSLEDIDDDSEVIISQNKHMVDKEILLTCTHLPLSGNVSDYPQKQALKPLYKNAVKLNKQTEEYLKSVRDKYINPNDVVLGVLARGTDYIYKKPKNENIQPEPIQVINKVKEVLNLYPEINKIYLATEDAYIYDLFKKNFGNMIIDNGQYRYYYDKSKKDFLANIKVNRPNHNYELGREYLSSIYILSKCKYFVGGRVAGTKYVWLWSEDKIYSYIFNLGKYGIDDVKKDKKHNKKKDLQIYKKLFSVENEYNKGTKHKVIRILGLKIKIKK